MSQPGPSSASVFTINAAGVVSLIASPNFEGQSVYTFNATVTDQGGLSSVSAVTVTILDVNERPTFDSPSYAVTIPENQPLGSDVVRGGSRTDICAGNEDGGTGTFVLINSTLNADQIIIGTNGFLGGTGTINGVVTNRGIFAPGNSPGRLEINGGFNAEAGSRLILEVESDGNGGFKTDELVFNAGQPLDLSGLKVEFRFLGATDPNAFQQSGGFETSTFFQMQDQNGTTGALAPELFGNVGFEASAEAYTITNFSFSATTGAGDFTATPVPEPGTTAMLLAGLASLGWLSRRRRVA
jgi:hypothetical protein